MSLKKTLFAFALLTSILTTGCSSAYIQSLGGETDKTFDRIYLTDFNMAWQSVLESLKHSRLDISNREGGFIQTKWTDNTTDKNFIDSFGGSDTYLKAQYRFKINLAKGYYNGRSSVKFTVQKEQLVQRDVLEGWRPIPTDSIDETTLLYRIARIIYMRTKIAKLEEEKAKKTLERALE